MTGRPGSVSLLAILVAVLFPLALGPVALASAAPVNDDFADATPFALTDPSPLAGDSTGATLEAGEPNHAGADPDHSIWWRFTADQDGEVALSTFGSVGNTALAVYTGSELTNLSAVAENDGYLGKNHSQVDFPVSAGTTYHVAVAGWGSGGWVYLTFGFDWEAGSIVLESPLGTPVGNIDLGLAEQPAVVDFGGVPVGDSARRTVVVRNVGDGPLTVESATLNTRSFAEGEYRVVSDTASGTAIAPGDHREVVVEFAPEVEPTGSARAVHHSQDLVGRGTLERRVITDDEGFGTIWGVFAYFRNAGGTGGVSYTAVASSDSVVRGQSEGAATLVGGAAYAMEAIVPHSGWGASESAVDFTVPPDYSSSRVFKPMPGSGQSVPFFTGVTEVNFHRLEDAVLEVLSDDPDAQGSPHLIGRPAGTFVSLFGERTNGAGVPPPDPTEPIEPIDPHGVARIAGSDRHHTAVLTSQARYREGEAGAVVLSRSDEFADALAGTPLAARRGGPLLLTPSASLLPVTMQEIERVLPPGGTVYLLGGEAALAPTVADSLRAAGFQVERLSGANRFETAVAIATEVGSTQAILLTTGLNFPDALAAGAAASANGGVVVLSADQTPHPATLAYLADHPGVPQYAIGGPAVAAHPTAQAVSGPTRHDTAVLVAEEFFSAPEVAGIARSDLYADALGGGAHIGGLGGPLLLTPTDALPAVVEQHLTANAPSLRGAFLYGGQSAISSQVEQAVEAAIE